MCLPAGALSHALLAIEPSRQRPPKAEALASVRSELKQGLEALFRFAAVEKASPPGAPDALQLLEQADAGVQALPEAVNVAFGAPSPRAKRRRSGGEASDDDDDESLLDGGWPAFLGPKRPRSDAAAIASLPALLDGKLPDSLLAIVRRAASAATRDGATTGSQGDAGTASDVPPPSAAAADQASWAVGSGASGAAEAAPAAAGAPSEPSSGVPPDPAEAEAPVGDSGAGDTEDVGGTDVAAPAALAAESQALMSSTMSAGSSVWMASSCVHALLTMERAPRSSCSSPSACSSDRTAGGAVLPHATDLSHTACAIAILTIMASLPSSSTKRRPASSVSQMVASSALRGRLRSCEGQIGGGTGTLCASRRRVPSEPSRRACGPGFEP